MNPEQLRIEKNRLSDVSQQISLLRRQHPGFSKLSGDHRLPTILDNGIKHNNEKMQAIINEIQLAKNNLEAQSKNINQFNMSSMQSTAEKFEQSINLKFAKIDQLQRDIDDMMVQLSICNTPKYFQYCDLINEQRRLEKLVLENDTSKPSLLTAFFYDEKQKRTLPINSIAALTNYLNTMWGKEFSEKHKLSPHYDKESEIDFRNPSGRSIITVTNKGVMMRDLHPSSNESLAQAMIEMYLKSVEGDTRPVHQTSGPGADYLAKKLALMLKSKGQEHHRINGILVTEILGSEKKLDQPLPSNQPKTASLEPTLPTPSISSDTANPSPLLTASKVDAPSYPATTPTAKTDALPDWYTASPDPSPDTDSSKSFKMR